MVWAIAPFSAWSLLVVVLFETPRFGRKKAADSPMAEASERASEI
jgi:hypothetical protein